MKRWCRKTTKASESKGIKADRSQKQTLNFYRFATNRLINFLAKKFAEMKNLRKNTIKLFNYYVKNEKKLIFFDEF